MDHTHTTLRQIGKDIAPEHGLSQAAAAKIIADITDRIVANLKAGGRVQIADIGILAVKDRKQRESRNPSTGEKIIIPAGRKVSFRPARALKEAL